MSAAPLGALPHPSRRRVWFQAVRVFSFTASIVPILVGSALALNARSFDFLLFLVMAAASVACHAGANLANDYYDHVKGIDTTESLGPSKVIQQGLLSPDEVRRGMVVAFAIATVLGLIVVAFAGWPIFVLALASLAAAYLYTGGPKPLGYIALGELVVFLFMGPVMVIGSYYVHAGEVTAQAVLASLPIGLLVAAILHANNVRDVDLDRAAGKITLATLLGRRGANVEYVLLVAGAYLAAVVLVISEWRLLPALIVAVSVPRAIALIRLLAGAAEAQELNVALRGTAGLHLRFGALLTVGLAVAALIDRVD